MINKFSQINQSPWLIDIYKKHLPEIGFLVEIGVGHTIQGIDKIFKETLQEIREFERCGSNTADLLDGGWSGIYIEPVAEYCEEAKIAHKNNSDRLQIVNLGAGNTSAELQLYLGDSFVLNKYSDLGYPWIGRFVKIKPTSDILSQYECPKEFELLSIDVEGFEKEVIDGIDFLKHFPKMIIVETNVVSKEEISKLLPNDYSIIAGDHLNTVWVK